MTVLSVVAGSALVLIALRDVFDTIFHPQGRGVVSGSLVRGVWRGTRALARRNHSILSLAGPLAFVTVIATWGAFVIAGFALVLWPYFPEEFASGSGIAIGDGLGDALYLSMVNLTSLGYGDIVPTSELLRFLGPLETVIGLGLLTAGISWILLLYRVLSESRSLSHEISLLLDAEGETGVALAETEHEVASRILADLTTRTVSMRDDLAHSPIAYYFHARDERHALPVILPRLLALADSCSGPESAPALRLQAAMLRRALDDLLETIRVDFLHTPPGDEGAVLAAWRRDHLWDGAERAGGPAPTS